MSQSSTIHPAAPLLDHCPPTLPARAYYDPRWYAAEIAHVWKPGWVHVGRVADLPCGTIRPVEVLGQRLILLRAPDGAISAFFNSCRHRGAELCATEAPLRGRRLTCPYHAWTYDMTGRLISTAHATPTADFRKEDHGLFPVHLHVWRGFLFVSLGHEPPPDEPLPRDATDRLDNWPLERLVVGERRSMTLACNWKVFWENYNECLHCPGVHPALSERVPLYARGIMAPNEAPGWTPEQGTATALRDGARSWTVSGRACGPEFPDLTEAERSAGMHFATLMPTMYLTAHVDFVRAVTVTPEAPEQMRLDVLWLFAPETLAAPGFDLSQAVDFAARVLDEDAAACEMNQRGLRSDRYTAGRLMPQEFDIAHFHAWLRARLPPSLEESP